MKAHFHPSAAFGLRRILFSTSENTKVIRIQKEKGISTFINALGNPTQNSQPQKGNTFMTREHTLHPLTKNAPSTIARPKTCSKSKENRALTDPCNDSKRQSPKQRRYKSKRRKRNKIRLPAYRVWRNRLGFRLLVSLVDRLVHKPFVLVLDR